MKIREYFFENNVERIEELLHNSEVKKTVRHGLTILVLVKLVGKNL